MRSKKEKQEKKQKSNIFKKLVIVALFIAAVGVVINTAPNFVKTKNSDKVTVIISNGDVTDDLKFDCFVDENEVVYMSTKDIANYFDGEIFYDNKYDQIITTSDTKVATLKIDEKAMYVNGSKVKLKGTAKKVENNFYLPISELNDVYNMEITYTKESNIITIDSLHAEQQKGNASKNISVKYKPTIFSKTIDTVQKGNSVIVISKNNNGWYKIRTNLGKIGYTKDITNVYTVREKLETKKQINEKVSLVWDCYYSSTAPDRTGTKINGVNVVSPSFAELVRLGQGELNIKIGTAGKKYVEWAHNNDYKVWAMVSNNSLQETTSEIINDYKLREKLINNIIKMTLENNLDGINLDFENVKESDKLMLSRLIIELAPRLKEYGKVLSVDVTAPDGGGDWSESYDRNIIGKVADYVVFMAYDEFSTGSSKAGTTAGADWIEQNIKKFIDREEVPADKIILGMPFYTRLWKETGSKLDSTVITMKNIKNNIPSNVQEVWNDEVKQYYIEYNQNGATYKMWIEDEKSIKEKFNLLNQYKLAGAAYWQKDFEPDTIWTIVEQELK